MAHDDLNIWEPKVFRSGKPLSLFSVTLKQLNRHLRNNTSQNERVHLQVDLGPSFQRSWTCTVSIRYNRNSWVGAKVPFYFSYLSIWELSTSENLAPLVDNEGNWLAFFEKDWERAAPTRMGKKWTISLNFLLHKIPNFIKEIKISELLVGPDYWCFSFTEKVLMIEMCWFQSQHGCKIFHENQSTPSPEKQKPLRFNHFPLPYSLVQYWALLKKLALGLHIE